MTFSEPIDIDSLLGEVEPEAPARRPIVLWLVVLSLVILFAPLYLVSSILKGDVGEMQAQLDAMHETLGSASETDAEAEPESPTAGLMAEINELSAVRSGLVARHVDWPAVLAVVNSYDGARITLNGLSQTENRVLVSGLAADEGAVLAFSQTLNDSGLFTRVIVQSISVADDTPGRPGRGAPGTTAGEPARRYPRSVEYTILLEVRAETS